MTRAKDSRKSITLPSRFEPAFWNTADGRCVAVKEIKRRYEVLRTDSGAESYQQDLLVQRAVFISLQLETMEIAAAQGERFDSGIYTQMTNSLLGLLKALGLERRIPQVANLKQYVRERQP